jgi:UDP-N-acetylmuramoyl-tripeptide--D-alanyl-D-alanine ligase
MSAYTPVEELYSFYLKANQSVCTDTRKLLKGSIFFALKGANFNANEFAQKAIDVGCGLAVIDEEKYMGTNTVLENN